MCLAVPGQVEAVRVEDGLRVGRVRFGGVTRDAVLEELPGAGPGDWVIVHVGFAIARLDEAEARRTLALLAEAARLQAGQGPAGAAGQGPEPGQGPAAGQGPEPGG